MGALQDAISDFDTVLKQRPKAYWSLYGRGLAEIGKGMTGSGQADIAAAAAIHPQIATEEAGQGLSA
jgi:hypothetical protein